MLNWLKKFSSPKLVNPEGLSNEKLQMLSEDLESLSQKSKELPGKLLKYIVDGDGSEILLKISGNFELAAALGLRCYAHGFTQKLNKQLANRLEFFKGFNQISPAILYRIGETYAALWHGKSGGRQSWKHLDPSLFWLEVLIKEVAQVDEWGNCPLRYGNKSKIEDIGWSAQHFEKVLQAGGHDPSRIAHLILMDEAEYGYTYHSQFLFESMQGQGECFARHPDVVSQALQHSKAAHRAFALNWIEKSKSPVDESIQKRIASLAVSSAKTVREAAESCIRSHAKARDLCIAEVKRLASEGTNTERLHSVGLLSRLLGEKATPLLEKLLEVEKGKKIQAEIQLYIGIQTAGTAEDSEENAYDDGLSIPEPRVFKKEYAISEDMVKDFLERVERYNARAIKDHATWWDRADPKWRRGKRDLAPPVSKKVAEKVVRGIATPDLALKGKQLIPLRIQSVAVLHAELTDFVQKWKLELFPIVRLGLLSGQIAEPNSQSNYWKYQSYSVVTDWIRNFIEQQAPDTTLIDIEEAYKDCGLSWRYVSKFYLSSSYGGGSDPLGLGADAIWPFHLKHIESLQEALGITANQTDVPSYYQNDYRLKAYSVLKLFPSPPKQFVAFLWSQALGTSKIERPLAQNCLSGFPGKEKLIVDALDDGKKDVRASAALWIKELHVEEAVPRLKSVLEKEKYDEPKAAYMEALESLGVDIDSFLNRKKLLEEAKKTLKKAIPKDLAWFPLDQLPEAHWEKNRQKVAPEILSHFIIQSFKLKSPEPGPLLRRYFALIRPSERKAIGEFVFNAWLTQDTLPRYTPQEASQLADQDAKRIAGYVSKNPQWYKDWDEAAYRKQAYNRLLNDCLGSANPSKGILAIAAVGCGPEVVPPIQKYLKQWYGMRVHQCKALLQMLSWVDHPLAIQLVLAIATRFRTKGIQQEAGRLADAIAERKGWTRDEMADRTIPTAGFEADGTQTIDYGARQFTATLSDDFSIELKNAADKAIKALPDANKAEDETEIKALKKEFSASKKELKQVLKMQLERLYEAMCTQRRWTFESWDLYLNRHPIVGRYCQRLVWIAYRGDERIAVFRPLADRTLTDIDDEEIELQPEDEIGLAHGSALPEDVSKAWMEHLADYEIEPIFQQFGNKTMELEEPLKKANSIDQFEGHLVNSYKLRSRANKLGYTRGSAEDGGWFYTYNKNFPSLKLQAVIEFTGNTLPEENRTVALVKLYFIRMKESAEDNYAFTHKPLQLSKLPKVMLSECWNDLRRISEDGTGYDKDWQKKSEY